jgi:hypothetical protein
MYADGPVCLGHGSGASLIDARLGADRRLSIGGHIRAAPFESGNLLMDPELVQELRQLREAVERLRETFESAASPASRTGQRDLADPEARLRRLSALFEDGVISDEDFENGKSALLGELLEA